MAKNKTTETNESITDFIDKVSNPITRNDCYKIAELMKEQTGFEPKMWGPAIIGFGSYHYKYESGREGDAPVIAFSPRSSAITLYMGSDFEDREELLLRLGKHKVKGGCVYIKKLSDIELSILAKMIVNSVKSPRHSQ